MNSLWTKLKNNIWDYIIDLCVAFLILASIAIIYKFVKEVYDLPENNKAEVHLENFIEGYTGTTIDL